MAPSNYRGVSNGTNAATPSASHDIVGLTPPWNRGRPTMRIPVPGLRLVYSSVESVPSFSDSDDEPSFIAWLGRTAGGRNADGSGMAHHGYSDRHEAASWAPALPSRIGTARSEPTPTAHVSTPAPQHTWSSSTSQGSTTPEDEELRLQRQPRRASEVVRGEAEQRSDPSEAKDEQTWKDLGRFVVCAFTCGCLRSR